MTTKEKLLAMLRDLANPDLHRLPEPWRYQADHEGVWFSNGVDWECKITDDSSPDLVMDLLGRLSRSIEEQEAEYTFMFERRGTKADESQTWAGGQWVARLTLITLPVFKWKKADGPYAEAYALAEAVASVTHSI